MVEIKKSGDTMTCYSKHVHDHNDTLAIFQRWKGDENQTGNMEAVITLTLDHDGHTYSKKIGFKVQ